MSTVLTGIAAAVGAILLLGSFGHYLKTKRFTSAEVLFCVVGFLLLLSPLANRLYLKWSDSEKEFEFTRKEVLALRSQVGVVQDVQEQALQIQQASLRSVAKGIRPQELETFERRLAAVREQLNRNREFVLKTQGGSKGEIRRMPAK